MFAVVHEQQQFVRPKKVDHGGFDAEALLLLQPQRRRDRVTDRRTVLERRELAEKRAVVELRLQPAGDLEPQPRLPDPSDTGQGHQRAVGERVDDAGYRPVRAQRSW